MNKKEHKERTAAPTTALNKPEQKKPAAPPAPMMVKTKVIGWYKNRNQTLYCHEDGALVRRLNASSCRSCLKKFEIRHPNFEVVQKMIRAGASLQGNALDLHVINKATHIIKKSPQKAEVTCCPMKMCIECGGAATLGGPCNCGLFMDDASGYNYITIKDVEIKPRTIHFTLAMKDYEPFKLSVMKKHFKGDDLIMLREVTKEVYPVHLNGPALREAMGKKRK